MEGNKIRNLDKLSQYIVVYLFIFFAFHASDLKRVHVWMTLYIEAESKDNFAIFSIAGTFFWLVGKFVLALPSIVISFVCIRFRFGSVTFNLFSIPHFFLWNSSYCGLHGSIFVVWRLYHQQLCWKNGFFYWRLCWKKMSFFIGYLSFFRCRFAISYGNSSIFLSSNV